MKNTLITMGNAELMAATRALVRQQATLEADLLDHLGEIDSRKLYLEHAAPTMVAFCLEQLGFSEDQAWNRITVARAGRRFPALIDALRSERIHFSGLRLIVPHLTERNCELVLRNAMGKSKRKIEELVACIAPKRPVPSLIRKVPDRLPTFWSSADACHPPAAFDASAVASRLSAATGASAASGASVAAGAAADTPAFIGAAHARPVHAHAARAVIAPLAEDAFKVQFTASRALRDKLRSAQDLLRHRVPDGNLATIVEQAVDLLLAKVKKERFGQGCKPRPAKAGAKARGSLHAGSPSSRASFPTKGPSRRVPSAVRRAVFERDGGRCTFTDASGRRCGETGGLELDHIDGFARKREHDPSRMRLLCRAHNQYAAEQLYGKDFMKRARKGPSPAGRAGASLQADGVPVPQG